MAEPIMTTDPNRQMSQQELAMQLQAMGDAGGENQELMRQMALSRQLRGEPQTKRMDWASQASRAMGGITNAMQMGREATQGKTAMGANRNITNTLMGILGNRGGGDPAMANNDDLMRRYSME